MVNCLCIKNWSFEESERDPYGLLTTLNEEGGKTRWFFLVNGVKKKQRERERELNLLKKKQLVLEPSFLKNCISDPTQISSFQSPPYAFVHRERQDPRPRHLPCQKLVRRHPHAAFVVILAVDVIVVVVIRSPILAVFVSQYLRPVRYVDWQRRRSRPDPIARGLYSFSRRLLPDPRAGNGLANIGGVRPGRAGVVEIRLIEFETRVGGDRRVVMLVAGEKTVAWPCVVTLTCRH